VGREPSTIGRPGDVDATAVTIRTRGGRLAQINTIRRAVYGYDQRFEVLGSKGMLQAGNHRPTEVTLWSSGAVTMDKPEYFFLERYLPSYVREWQAFVEAVKTGATPPVSTTDARAPLVIGLAAGRSLYEGRPVRIEEV
jgi:myo-inositol 2-dehydrogenase/D-chiro-inositol 1-dehydrogenase